MKNFELKSDQINIISNRVRSVHYSTLLQKTGESLSGLTTYARPRKPFPNPDIEPVLALNSKGVIFFEYDGEIHVFNNRKHVETKNSPQEWAVGKAHFDKWEGKLQVLNPPKDSEDHKTLITYREYPVTAYGENKKVWVETHTDCYIGMEGDKPIIRYTKLTLSDGSPSQYLYEIEPGYRKVRDLISEYAGFLGKSIRLATASHNPEKGEFGFDRLSEPIRKRRALGVKGRRRRRIG